MRILVVGESWGENELALGRPFVGSAGQELARMGAKANLWPSLPWQHPTILQMSDFWEGLESTGEIRLTNVFRAHPENNQVENFFGLDGNRNLPPLKPGKYILPEYMPHLIKLWDEVNTAKPNVVLALGNVSAWALLGRTYISRIRGTIAWSERTQTKVIPTYHPSYIIRGGQEDRPIVIVDFQKALRESTSPEIHRPERYILRDPTLEEIAEWLTQPAEFYAIDIESGYALYSKAEIHRMSPKERYFLSSQISMVGFARSASQAMVVEFMARNKPGLSYWPDKDTELSAWRLIRKGLKTPTPKVFQNTLYDVTRFIEMGFTPNMCTDDTMLRQHARYPEMLKGLGFLASIFIDDWAWKQIYQQRESLKRDD